MANPEHVSIVSKGVETWNEWRSQTETDGADLSGLDFRANGVWHLAGANLSNVDFQSANLSSVSLRDVNLRAAKLMDAVLDDCDLNQGVLDGAVLRGTSMIKAQFLNASLKGTDLSFADLSESYFGGAHFFRTKLLRANLSHARFGLTIFGDVDLRDVSGLESAKHFSPSTVGINTIMASAGNIPEAFLRGAGVPEQFIIFAKSLVSSAIEYYSLFISYSTADQEFAERLHADLQARGIRCWFAPHDIRGGRKLHEQIDEAIRFHDKLLLILSPNSMESEWVKTEISKARKRETRDKARVLFPVRLVPFEVLWDWKCFDADTGKDSAREIREYFIPDFSNRKNHDSYRAALDRLVRDLQAPARCRLDDL